MFVETETIQLFQLLWLSREFARLKAMTEKVHSHVLYYSYFSDKRLLTAYKKIPSSRSGSTVVMDDRSINLLIELSSIGGLPHLYIVSYFKSGIKDLSWKKKAHSCSSVSFPPVLSSWMKCIRMISSPWVYIHACVITVRNVHKAKGYISFSQQLVSVRHSYHIWEDRRYRKVLSVSDRFQLRIESSSSKLVSHLRQLTDAKR